MQPKTLIRFAPLLAGALLLAGCAASNTAPAPAAETVQATRAPAAPAPGQTTFASDDEAAKAFLTAIAADDRDTVHQILGPAWKDLLTGDKVQDANAFKEFAASAAEKNRLERKDADTTILHVGDSDWPDPIPIVRDSASGKWFFDTEAGKAEILARHIGADELGAIDVCRAYVRAQRQYFRMPHDISDVLQYAQCILSKPGTQCGLYYPVAAGEKESPFGPLVADAEFEGYSVGTYDRPHALAHAPYHGYHFKILKAQGPDAPGGAYSYIINGHMLAGFALVAFPDKYGDSGIMTFIVNQRGKVYQRDLGPNTTDAARKMTEYNPDSSWILVPQ